MTIRKKRLIQPAQYMRLLNMDLNQIIRFIGETEYQDEINKLAGSLSGMILLESALTQNLADTYRDILKMAPGALHELAMSYFARWDISNVLLILRGKEFGIDIKQIREVLIPAGSLSMEKMNLLLQHQTPAESVTFLKDWDYAPILQRFNQGEYHKGRFAELENEMYKLYYTGLYRDAKSGIRGGDALVPQIKFEIDIINVRNTFRIHSGSRVEDIRPYIIPGGNLQPDDFQQVYTTEDREQFIAWVKKTKILGVMTEALQDQNCDPSECEHKSADIIWKRWHERKTPLFGVMMAVNRVMHHHL